MHGSYLDDRAATSAGTVKIDNGKILEITSTSGHYAPDQLDMYRMIKVVQNRMPGVLDKDCSIKLHNSNTKSIVDFITEMEAISPSTNLPLYKQMEQERGQQQEEYKQKLAGLFTVKVSGDLNSSDSTIIANLSAEEEQKLTTSFSKGQDFRILATDPNDLIKPRIILIPNLVNDIVYTQNSDAMKVLLNAGLNLNETQLPSNYDILKDSISYAKNNDYTLPKILLENSNVRKMIQKGYENHKQNILVDAVKTSNFGLVQEILKYQEGSELLDKPDTNGYTPLAFVRLKRTIRHQHNENISEEEIKIINLLVEKSVLKEAMKYGIHNNDALAKELVGNENNIKIMQDEYEKYGNNFLHVAVKTGNLSLVQEMLNHKEGLKLLSKPNEDGQTPLDNAVIGGKVKLVEEMLNHQEGIELLSKPNRDGDTPLTLIKRRLVMSMRYKEDMEILKLLEEKQVKQITDKSSLQPTIEPIEKKVLNEEARQDNEVISPINHQAQKIELEKNALSNISTTAFPLSSSPKNNEVEINELMPNLAKQEKQISPEIQEQSINNSNITPSKAEKFAEDIKSIYKTQGIRLTLDELNSFKNIYDRSNFSDISKEERLDKFKTDYKHSSSSLSEDYDYSYNLLSNPTRDKLANEYVYDDGFDIPKSRQGGANEVAKSPPQNEYVYDDGFDDIPKSRQGGANEVAKSPPQNEYLYDDGFDDIPKSRQGGANEVAKSSPQNEYLYDDWFDDIPKSRQGGANEVAKSPPQNEYVYDDGFDDIPKSRQGGANEVAKSPPQNEYVYDDGFDDIPKSRQGGANEVAKSPPQNEYLYDDGFDDIPKSRQGGANEVAKSPPQNEYVYDDGFDIPKSRQGGANEVAKSPPQNEYVYDDGFDIPKSRQGGANEVAPVDETYVKIQQLMEQNEKPMKSDLFSAIHQHIIERVKSQILKDSRQQKVAQEHNIGQTSATIHSDRLEDNKERAKRIAKEQAPHLKQVFTKWDTSPPINPTGNNIESPTRKTKQKPGIVSSKYNN